MGITRTDIRKLCTATEATLAEKALPHLLKDLTVKQLQQKVARARRMRDKYRDLYKRQTLAARKPGKSSGKGKDLNARTKEKATFFADILNTFQQQVTVLNKAEKAAAAKTAKAKKTTKKPAQKKPAKKLSPQQKLALAAKRKKDRAAKNKAAKTKTGAKAKKAAATEDNVKGFGSYASKQAQGVGHKRQMQQSLQRPILGHVKSAGKRKQAKRDSR